MDQGSRGPGLAALLDMTVSERLAQEREWFYALVGTLSGVPCELWQDNVRALRGRILGMEAAFAFGTVGRVCDA